MRPKDDGSSPHLNDNTDVSTQKLTELQREFEEVKSDLQSEVDASKKVNFLLLQQIQHFKTQKLLTEQNILQSNTFKQLRKEAEELLKIVEQQQQEIGQLRVVKDSVEKVRSDL